MLCRAIPAVVLAGVLVARPAGAFPLPKLASPADVSAAVDEFKLPPIGPGDAPFRPDQFAYLATAWRGYEPDITTDDIRKAPNRYPLRVAVLDAAATIRDVWTPPPPDKKGKKDKDAGPRPLFRSELASPVTEPMKRQILELQVFPARGIAKLDQAIATLTALADDRKREPKRWQAHYDLVLAECHARLAFLHEYDLMLGKVRTDSLPDLDAAKGQNRWRLVPSEKLQSKKDVQEIARQARERFEAVAKAHPGTPWAARARHAAAVPLGLAWVPVGGK